MRSPLYALVLASLVGCPASEPVYQFTDVGLSRQDTLVPGGPTNGNDVGILGDRDTQNPLGGDETVNAGECTLPTDCDLTAAACEVVRCTDGACVLDPLPDGGACDDDDKCSITSCVSGACSKTGTIECPDDADQCTKELCSPELGCTSLPTQGTPCDDNDPCTSNDQCAQGLCKGTKVCAIGTQENPAASCSAIKQAEANTPSGPYWLKSTTGAAVEVFCDMTTQGGGWMRIAAIDGKLPLCNLTAGVGTPAAVLTGTGTAILPAATVATLPTSSADVLVVLSKGPLAFRSTHADWKWSAIAAGTINAGNSATYAVQVSADGDAFQALKSNPAGGKGPTLLGGVRTDSKYTSVFGIGAYGTGSFTQDAGCVSLTGNKGMWGGTIFPGIGVWAQSGSVYIK